MFAEGVTHKITISRVAIYMRDNFDFEDEGVWRFKSQPLGTWDCGSKEYGTLGGEIVDNADLQEFRERHHVGGDFYVMAAPDNIAGFEEISYEK